MGKKPRDKRDIYYRKAKEYGWRARSAFKLLQIDETFSLFTPDVKHVVDLCAAPGSWSQVLQRKLRGVKDAKIVSVDLQKMAPLKGVRCIQGDITDIKTVKMVLDCFPDNTKADLIVCDAAPDVTGMHDLDEYVQHQLIMAALDISTKLLREGGNFVTKIFRGKDVELLYMKFSIFFEKMYITKPKSSRKNSIESFLVCKNFSSLKKKKKKICEVKMDSNERFIVPFLQCGDLSAFDSDVNYQIDDDEGGKDVLAPPQNPAYSKQLEYKRQNHPNFTKI